eukprot:CAMPEP_0204327956 /NCGR_PEP_ID=MMETSP0469-20131031/13005_1 /ASSEMBLY_ACC=CAM_ASM_000384 /TAXON_ID=2969 /ORGANISM="Oxyrrhis marina" /LENGTH=344 /DNA_ID=CAMNT_0051310271 /DNA_START=34 /DNA_END=1065 /DNA_ORIENTATION=-
MKVPADVWLAERDLVWVMFYGRSKTDSLTQRMVATAKSVGETFPRKSCDITVALVDVEENPLPRLADITTQTPTAILFQHGQAMAYEPQEVAALKNGAPRQIERFLLKRCYELKKQEFKEMKSLTKQNGLGVQFNSKQLVDFELWSRFYRGRKDGIFVEIGANDGKDDSHTFFFEQQMGWRGVCLEPLPDAFARLEGNRPLCKNEMVAACSSAGVKPFVQLDSPVPGLDQLSGLQETYDPRHLKSIDEKLKKFGGTKTVIDVTCVLINEVLARHKLTNIDVMIVDTEGSELSILKTLDFDSYRVSTLVVENNFNETGVRDFLATKGYRRVAQVDVDDIYTVSAP